MKFAPLLLLLFFHALINAQDKAIKIMQLESGKAIIKVPPPDTSNKVWKAGGLYRLNLGQGTLSNWAGGGDDFSININSTLNLFATHKKSSLHGIIQ